MSKKHSVAKLMLISALLLFAYCLRFVFHPLTDNALLGISMMTLRWAIQVSLTILWISSIHRRILLSSIRRMLLTTGGLLLGWQIVRIIKYDYVIITEPIGRYCWYAFYIAMLMVPLIGVFVVNHIGKPEGYHSPAWMKYLFIPAFLLLAVVFTNDLHQLVFTFGNGFELFNSDYGYGFMYIPVMAWFIVLALFFAIGLMVKSRVPGSKRFQALPLGISIFAICFWVGYSAGLISCDLTAVDSLIIIMLLESAIQSGLIPSNMNYKNLFEQSTIAAQIVDNHQNVHFSSANAAPLDSVVLEKAKLAPVRLNNTLLHAQPLSGGYVYWQDDLKAINELTKHLQEANEILSENYDLMKAEVELKERRLHVVEKTRLYDRIAHEIMPQLNKADALLEQSRQQPERAKELLSQVCVLSAYIKRRANLILVGEEKETIPAKELQSCLHESLDNLRLCGILTYLDFHCDGQAGTRQIIALYDLFEAAIDLLLNHLSAAMVTAEQAGSTLQLRIQLGCKDSIPELPAWTLPGGAVTCEMQERDLILTAKIDLGGESA